MTGNQIKGKGFRGALRYNLEKLEKGMAELLDFSFVGISEKTIMKEVQMVRVLRPNLQKYFYHTSINFPPQENLSNETMKQIGLDYLQANGFTQHQYIMFRHFDAAHPHLHILVNRIGYDGKVLSDSNDYQRSEKVLRELEVKYNLVKVTSSKEAKERAMTKDELEMMKRTNVPSQKMQLQILIKDALQSNEKISCEDFIKALEAKGIGVLFNQASTGYVSGISYSYQEIIVKGAKLGSDFKWPSIKNNINYEQERDRATVHQANVRARALHADTKTGDGNFTRDSKTLRQGGVNSRTTSNPVKLLDQKHPKENVHTGQPARSAQQQDVGDRNQFQEKPNGLDLASLLDGHYHGDVGQYIDKSNLDALYALTKKKRKKKKRRSL
jgi:Relaxase/Mobilisation nuclease domain